MPLSSEKARQNALMGGGRPKGSISKATRDKIAKQKHFNLRIVAMADKLLNAQAVVAIGTHRMVIVTVDEEGKKHIETVRDETRMQNLLDTGVYGEDYLILEGAKADWKAANALLDRAFGKAKESLELSGEVKFSLRGLAERRILMKNEAEVLELDSGADELDSGANELDSGAEESLEEENQG